MFAWFKKKPATDNELERIARQVPEILGRVGDLMEKYPAAYMDESWLPLPKPQMKVAFQLAWVMFPEPQQRELIKIAWGFMPNFQKGIGEKPIDPTIRENMTPAEIMKALEPYTRMSKTVELESQATQKELREFIASQGVRAGGR